MLARALKLQDRLSDFIGKAVSWLCLVMIGVLMYEVIGRYLFNNPTEWAHESTTMLYGTFCILGGVYTHLHNGHVRSEAVYHLFPPKGRAILDVVTGLVGLAVFGVFFFVAFDFALESWQANEHSSKSTWAPPIYPFKSVLPLAAALSWLQSLVHLIRDLAVVFNVAPEIHQQGQEHRELQTDHLKDVLLPVDTPHDTTS